MIESPELGGSFFLNKNTGPQKAFYLITRTYDKIITIHNPLINVSLSDKLILTS